MKQKILKIKSHFDKYAKYTTPIALIGGFIIDNLTLRRADMLIENLLFLFYLTLISISIIIVGLYDTSKITKPILGIPRGWFIFFMQFAFGGIFSGFTVFYLRSSSLFTSWPFILILILIMISTELNKKIYNRLTVQIAVLYLALVTLSIYAVPILTKTFGSWTFLLSLVVAVGLIGIYIHLTKFFLGRGFKDLAQRLRSTIVTITALVLVLYFTNLIPPIPLLAKDVGVYNFVSRDSGGNYTLERTPCHWSSYFKLRDEIEIGQSRQAYFYSAIYAPAKINTKIFHHWQYYDEAKNRWVSDSKIGFVIFGGNDEGYRGYTHKTVSKGLWRVDVITENGRVISREVFMVT